MWSFGGTKMGKRVGMIDEIRGIAYIAMIVYHAYYDIAFMYGIDLPDAADVAMKWLQPFIAGTFIFIAGISCNYSSNNFKRGALYLFFASDSNPSVSTKISFLLRLTKM